MVAIGVTGDREVGNGELVCVKYGVSVGEDEETEGRDS